MQCFIRKKMCLEITGCLTTGVPRKAAYCIGDTALNSNPSRNIKRFFSPTLPVKYVRVQCSPIREASGDDRNIPVPPKKQLNQKKYQTGSINHQERFRGKREKRVVKSVADPSVPGAAILSCAFMAFTNEILLITGAGP